MLLYDTVMVDEGRRCRIEVAIDISEQESQNKVAGRYQNLEMLVNNALGVALQKSTPDGTIQCLLEHMGHILKAERVYVFEKNEQGGDDNSYEWVAAGVTTERERLQGVPPGICEPWYRQFQNRNHVVIQDLEEIREKEPLLYQILKPQDIQSLVVMPLEREGEIVGFYGVDNPPVEMLEYTIGILHIMGHFIAAALNRRDLVRKLFNLSHRDQQTGLGNRYALRRFVTEVVSGENLGVLFCDITGLKKVNDEQGHKAGDEMIARAAECLRRVYAGYHLFRFGGDELVALCLGIEQDEVQKKAEQLKVDAQENAVVLSVGTAWAARDAVNIDRLLSEAETNMYEDKAQYYRITGIDRRRY